MTHRQLRGKAHVVLLFVYLTVLFLRLLERQPHTLRITATGAICCLAFSTCETWGLLLVAAVIWLIPFQSGGV